MGGIGRGGGKARPRKRMGMLMAVMSAEQMGTGGLQDRRLRPASVAGLGYVEKE